MISSFSFQSAVNGIQKGLSGLERNSAEIASARQQGGEASPLEPLLDSRLNQLQLEASVKVLKAADETLGSLLDEHA